MFLRLGVGETSHTPAKEEVIVWLHVVYLELNRISPIYDQSNGFHFIVKTSDSV